MFMAPASEFDASLTAFDSAVSSLKVQGATGSTGTPTDPTTPSQVLAFATFQTFFCCTGCKTHYKEKHAGRIESIVEQFRETQKEAKSKSLKKL
jgi:hypothetical protein